MADLHPVAMTFSPAHRVLIDVLACLVVGLPQSDNRAMLIQIIGETLPHALAMGLPQMDRVIVAAGQYHAAEPVRRAWLTRSLATDQARQAAAETCLTADFAASRALEDFFFWRASVSNAALRASLATDGAAA